MLKQVLFPKYIKNVIEKVIQSNMYHDDREKK